MRLGLGSAGGWLKMRAAIRCNWGWSLTYCRLFWREQLLSYRRFWTSMPRPTPRKNIETKMEAVANSKSMMPKLTTGGCETLSQHVRGIQRRCRNVHTQGKISAKPVRISTTEQPPWYCIQKTSRGLRKNDQPACCRKKAETTVYIHALGCHTIATQLLSGKTTTINEEWNRGEQTKQTPSAALAAAACLNGGYEKGWDLETITPIRNNTQQR